jgi:glycosyltransferase involved in cell wall biosynthesis
MADIKNKKILYILSGNEPSGIVRARIYGSEWMKRGNKVRFVQLKSEWLLKLMMKAKPLLLLKLLTELLLKITTFTRQWYLLRIAGNYDIIIAVKYLKSPLLSKIKAKSKALLVYDFDDAVWLDSFAGEEEFSKRVSIADFTTSGNFYLASRASKYNEYSYVLAAPCQVEAFEAYQQKNRKPEKKDELVIGWIGSASTLFSLFNIYDALETIGEKYPFVVLKLVGTDKDKKMVPRFEKIKTLTVTNYDQEEMIKQVSSFDIGIYPLFLSELSLGRGPLKATIYMAAKVPFVCSGYIENNKFVEEGVTGFLANNKQEWVEKLSLLLENQELREKMGQKGNQYATNHFSIEKCTDKFCTYLLKHLK